MPASGVAGIPTDELLHYEIEISDNGHASYNARSGKDDDLIIALGLSVVDCEDPNRKRPKYIGSRIVKDRWGGGSIGRGDWD